MVEEEYELMPHEIVENLKKELEDLKKRAVPVSPDVKQSIESLNENIISLKSAFEQAAGDIRKEEMEEEDLLKKIEPIIARVNEIESENRKIAEGILVIADMIRERMPKHIPPSFKKHLSEMRKPTFNQPHPKPLFVHAPAQPAPPAQKPFPQKPLPSFAQRPQMIQPPPFPRAPPRAAVPMLEPEEPSSQFYSSPKSFQAHPDMPPLRALPTPMGLPPMPDFEEHPKKKGFFAKLFGK